MPICKLYLKFREINEIARLLKFQIIFFNFFVNFEFYNSRDSLNFLIKPREHVGNFVCLSQVLQVCQRFSSDMPEKIFKLE